VSHELRTPLQSTLTWAQSERPTDPAQSGTRRAGRPQRAPQARLIDDPLDIPRILGKLLLS
jgi:hypothetical protein